MSPRRLALALLLGVTALAAPSGAAAAPSAAPDAEAVALFDEGRKRMAEKKFDEAIARFEESLRHARTVGALLNLGRCYEETGRAASAWATYRAAGSLARELHDAREADADRFATAVRPRVSTLKLDATSLAGVSGVVVRRDGVVISEASRGDAAPVDPGTHAIEVSAPGKAPWRRDVRVGPDGDAAAVRVPPLADAPAPARVEVATTEAPRGPHGTGAKTLGIVAVAAGAVGIGLGATAGLVALGKHHDATAACPDYPSHCPSSGAADAPNSASQTWATVSTVGFAVGGAALVTGIVLLVTSGKDAPSNATAARVTPIVTARGAGVGVGAAW